MDVPVENIGFGFPNSLVPMYDYWELPDGRKRSDPGIDLERPHDFFGEYLWIGFDASNKELVAKALRDLKTVKYLVLDAYTISQEVLDSLATMEQLERLDMAPTRTKRLNFLDGLVRLRYLNIEAVPNVDDLSPIIRLENLISLGLGTSVSSLDAFRNGSLKKLRCLVLGGTGESKPVRWPTLQPLQNLQNLEYLCPLNCRVADKSLSFAFRMQSLRGIHIYRKSWWNNDNIVELMEKGVEVSSSI